MKPNVFTDEVGREICERSSCGHTLADVCQLDHMPYEFVVRGWLHDADPPDFVRAYNRAVQIGAKAEFDRLQGEVNKATPDNVSVVRLRAEVTRWRLSKVDPERFGDNSSVSVNHSVLQRPRQIIKKIIHVAWNGDQPPGRDSVPVDPAAIEAEFRDVTPRPQTVEEATRPKARDPEPATRDPPPPAEAPGGMTEDQRAAWRRNLAKIPVSYLRSLSEPRILNFLGGAPWSQKSTPSTVLRSPPSPSRTAFRPSYERNSGPAIAAVPAPKPAKASAETDNKARRFIVQAPQYPTHSKAWLGEGRKR